MAELVLVTGGTGFLGRHLVLALQREGLPVRALVRPGNTSHPVANFGAAELVTGDILDLSSLRTALSDVTMVFHLAGRLHTAGIAAETYEQLHVEGTRNLLTVCQEAGRLRVVVHCSTTGILGPTGSIPAAEDALTLGPSNAYEHSKAKGEQLARDFAHQHNLPLVVVRPSLVYGPGDLHLLGWFRSIQHGYYFVVGPGDNLLHPIYVDDLINGLMCCAQMPTALGRVYNIVGSRPIPIKEIAAAIARALGRQLPGWHIPLPLARGAAMLLESLPGTPPAYRPLSRSRIDFMTENRAYSGARAKTELGFIPQIDLETGLQRAVVWYRREGLL